jgi:hypothetical protein
MLPPHYMVQQPRKPQILSSLLQKSHTPILTILGKEYKEYKEVNKDSPK